MRKWSRVYLLEVNKYYERGSDDVVAQFRSDNEAYKYAKDLAAEISKTKPNRIVVQETRAGKSLYTPNLHLAKIIKERIQ